ncbi:MAG: hypothetical protein DCC71_14870 [Proteobacteria bacterium]|nr:MAG: hypothetical protein DCC71_14870 [Pseudomonadota bacterium]
MQPPAEALAWLSGAQAHIANVRRLREPSGTQRAGERSPGVVFVATAVRAPDLDAGEFDAHWRERHAPLALRHHAGMSGYEQLTVKRTLGAPTPNPDGIALLHFPDLASFRERFYDSDAGRDAILADAREFLDLPRCRAILASEYWARV